MMVIYKSIFAIILVVLLVFTTSISNANTSPSVRIKDIAKIHGIYDKPIFGYGLVVGLNGTGDSAGAMITVQSVINMMQRFGIDIPQSRISLKNVAAAMVTAELPFFAKAGGRIDVLVSSIGDAKSIAGGTLLLTPLTLPDGTLCALAQGTVSVGGFLSSSGSGDNTVIKNHPTVGHVPNGGLIQNVPQSVYNSNNTLIINIYDPDFTTISRLVSVVNEKFQGVAQAIDAGAISVNIPQAYQNNVVEFISQLENLTLIPDSTAEIIIDERTGTIVVGKDVKISPVAISHGNLSIKIKTELEASQPSPFSSGETVILEKENLEVQEESKNLKILPGGASIDEVVRALNLLGVSPRDMITILQAIKKAGALHANLKTM
ncbi:MAG: flagellar basal body P-ring protein FlgI [bacterium]